MQWSELYSKEQEPSSEQLSDFVGNPLWDALNNYLVETYGIQAMKFYSCCAMDKGLWKGWNLKYRKAGKALCTLYPKKGYFLALVNIGKKESEEAELLIPSCDNYTQQLYNKTISGNSGKMLAIEVNSDNILKDLKKLIALRIAN
jgi:AraC family transcriptional regulator